MECDFYLFDVLLEQPQGEPLVQLDLLGVPFLFEGPVVVQDLVNYGQDVTGTLAVVGRRVAAGSIFEIRPFALTREKNILIFGSARRLSRPADYLHEETR